MSNAFAVIGFVLFAVTAQAECRPFEVDRVLDGDTVDGWWLLERAELGDVRTSTERFVRVRLEDVRAPETRGVEREDGLLAKAVLEAVLEAGEVELCDAVKPDGRARSGGFGRVLGRLEVDGEDAGSMLVELGLAGRGRSMGWQGP